MKQLRRTACGLGLVLMGMIALSNGEPSPAPQSPSINQAIDHEQFNSIEDTLESADKRAWSSLNNVGWGKRAWKDMNSAWGKRAWKDMNSAWGKRGWNDMNSAWGKRGWSDMNTPWGKRAWQNLHGAWGKRAWKDMSSAWGKRTLDKDLYDSYLDFLAASRPQPEDEESYENSIDDIPMDLLSRYSNDDERFEKERKLVKKEAPQTKWKPLVAAWGKRQPGWNNLKGLWGKRSMPIQFEDSLSEYADRQDD